jgi:hypothetical protein
LPNSAERAVGCELDERFVEVSVVLAVEQEHLVTAGDDPRHPGRLRVGLRGGERELPHRQRVSAGELLGDDDRVLGREQELVAPRYTVGDGPDDRLGSVAAEHRHVRDVEV